MVSRRFQIEQRAWCPLAADESELMTLTEAAKALGLRHVNTLASLVAHGRLRRVRDNRERNPKKQGRVFRVDVERELARRRELLAVGDRRMKGGGR